MIIESVIITGIICGVVLLGYIAKLAFFSKCDSCSFWGIKVHRNTKEEAQTVSTMRLPIGSN